MGKIKSHREIMAFRFSIYLEVISCTILGSILCGAGYAVILRNIAISITGIMVFVYYYGLKGGRMLKAVSSQKTFLISFAVSNLLVAFTSIADIGTVWMVAIAVVAAREGMGHAVSCHMLLLLQYLILSADAAGTGNTRIIIFYAVLGILLALVVSEIKKRRLFLYAAVIFISLTLVMAVVLYGLGLKAILDNKDFIIKCIAGDVVLLITSWVTYCIKRAGRKNQRVYGKEHLDESALMELAATDHELMQRIRQYSEPLYTHSVMTGSLSYKAADYTGHSAVLAQAGGFYHEAGRIYEDKDYKEACSQLSGEYKFPAQLEDIIMHHGASYGKPKSPEAAIVMLSDSIISAGEYFERTGKREQISDEKLVRSIFNSRIARGNLDNSGLSKEQIEKLMYFYINNAFKEEAEEEQHL